MVRERGSGITPPRVVELLKKEVAEKSILAVSKATGLGLAAIGRYLKGIGEPTTSTLQKLSAYFGKSVAYLRGEIHEIRYD
jgi:transcriptional regulator with XRE-family HTH domain